MALATPPARGCDLVRLEEMVGRGGRAVHHHGHFHVGARRTQALGKTRCAVKHGVDKHEAQPRHCGKARQQLVSNGRGRERSHEQRAAAELRHALVRVQHTSPIWVRESNEVRLGIVRGVQREGAARAASAAGTGWSRGKRRRRKG